MLKGMSAYKSIKTITHNLSLPPSSLSLSCSLPHSPFPLHHSLSSPFPLPPPPLSLSLSPQTLGRRVKTKNAANPVVTECVLLSPDSKDGARKTYTVQDFVRKVDMNGKVLVSLELPALAVLDQFRSFKITPRSQVTLITKSHEPEKVC